MKKHISIQISMKPQKDKNIEFGMLVTLILLIVSVWMRNDWYKCAIATIAVAMLVPELYTPFAWLWFRVAHIIEQATSKIVLFLIFSMVITPVGIIRRLAGKNSLQLKRFKDRRSVFEVKKHQYTQNDMEKQF